MIEDINQYILVLVYLIQIIGAGILTLGFIIATLKWFVHYRRYEGKRATKEYRRALGRVILIGLEILVAATIIKTIILEHTVEAIGLLVFTIVIRTVLGWTTVLEMNGRWPWQKS